MIIIKKLASLAVCLFLVSGCYQKTLLFEAETISVTQKDSGEKKLKIGKEVEKKWCQGETPVYNKDQNPIGTAEQAIFLAQGKGKKADFIVEARIFVDTNNCTFVEGKRASIK